MVVVNNKNSLLGTLTEEISKSFIKNVKINSNIKSLYNKSPKKINLNNINLDTISKFLLKVNTVRYQLLTQEYCTKVITWPQIFNSKK